MSIQGAKVIFKILIVVFPTQWMSTIQGGSGIHHPPKGTVPRPRKTTIKHLRLERDGYSFTINNIRENRESADGNNYRTSIRHTLIKTPRLTKISDRYGV
jgi:hypothetical protein